MPTATTHTFPRPKCGAGLAPVRVRHDSVPQTHYILLALPLGLPESPSSPSHLPSEWPQVTIAESGFSFLRNLEHTSPAFPRDHYWAWPCTAGFLLFFMKKNLLSKIFISGPSDFTSYHWVSSANKVSQCRWSHPAPRSFLRHLKSLGSF